MFSEVVRLWTDLYPGRSDRDPCKARTRGPAGVDGAEAEVAVGGVVSENVCAVYAVDLAAGDEGGLVVTGNQ